MLPCIDARIILRLNRRINRAAIQICVSLAERFTLETTCKKRNAPRSAFCKFSGSRKRKKGKALVRAPCPGLLCGLLFRLLRLTIGGP